MLWRSSIFAVLAGAILLGDRPGVLHWAAVFAGFLGIADFSGTRFIAGTFLSL